ncbi:MarR family winged helix-turn-helix transcriptional regulator [Pseudonocardia oroxyli]|uniref:DNA-binding transcriptional regulator, MarR family n=1 Tax=Pseudonocardia oroxyli TaxID=366584 RepID=A0A1G7PRE1_PSEOR|nr:MarR family winged helix-turn-helix transcriptional regulator [Pseudonocardia oroxyli]SDF87980.1 DNA-binding transcriptional regulator, MarR family [Pseudonocardia oroxyli]
MTAAFLLSQLGVHAAAAFGERIAALDLTPPQTGLIRLVAAEPGLPQQAIAARLGMPASRLVALVDGLDERGIVERRRNPEDRRLHALHLTEAGGELLARIAAVGREHDEAITAALDPGERKVLRDLLERIAEQQGLTPGVHPGYRRL